VLKNQKERDSNRDQLILMDEDDVDVSKKNPKKKKK